MEKQMQEEKAWSMIRIPRQLYNELKVIAAVNGRPAVWEIRMILEQAVRQQSEHELK